MLSTCTACSYEWTDYGTYAAEYKAAHDGLGPYTQEVKLPSNCIGLVESTDIVEEVTSQVDKLITLVEKNFLMTLISDLNKLGYNRPPEDAYAMVWHHLNALEDEYDDSLR